MSRLTDRDHFEALAGAVCAAPQAAGLDRASLSLAAESSDFLRFNRAALRQATQVLQAQATLAVVRGSKRAESSVSLSGDLAQDTRRLLDERARLLSDLDFVPDDPWLLLPQAATTSLREDHGALPEAETVIAAVREPSESA